MKHTLRWSIGGLAALAAVGTAVALVSSSTSSATGTAGLAAAEAPGTPGWRLTATPDSGGRLWNLSVVNAKDAWAVGDQTVKQHTYSLVRHWNGKTWTKVALPSVGGGNYVYLASVSASSASNVWISGQDNNGAGHTYLFHWNGRGWSTSVGNIPKNTEVFFMPHVLALSATDVWSFFLTGQDTAPVPDVQHFDGRRWSKVRVPAPIGYTSVVSGRSIWALGSHCLEAACGVITHWTGKGWTTTPQPPTTGPSTKYWGSYYTGVVARSDKDVWVTGIANLKTAPGQEELFLHWDGKTWNRMPVPAGLPQIRGLTDDGAGGFWAISLSPAPMFFHYQAGKWTSEPQPSKAGYMTNVETLVRIPQTTSVWGAGALYQGHWIAKSDGIVKYGK